MNKISVVIPCYNSENTLHDVVCETIRTLDGLTDFSCYEIILVNDYSKDFTFNTIRDLCNNNKKIIGINLSKNFGQPSATLAGFSVASGDVIVYSDDDGQTPINELPKLLNKLNEGFDMVFAKFTEYKLSPLQKLGSKINNSMSSYLIGKPKHIHMGSFYVCKNFIIKESLKCNNPFPYLAGIVLGITMNMASVPTSHRKRTHGKSNYTIKKLTSLWLNGFTAFSVKPLRIASIVGFLTALIGFIFIIAIIYNKIKYPTVPAGYSSIISAIFFIGGMIMLMLGLIGEYVGRIYLNINKKPQYVIKEKIN